MISGCRWYIDWKIIGVGVSGAEKKAIPELSLIKDIVLRLLNAAAG